MANLGRDWNNKLWVNTQGIIELCEWEKDWPSFAVIIGYSSREFYSAAKR